MNEIKDLDPLVGSKDAQENNTPVKRGRGRPPGAKNKDTIFKELMTGEFQDKAAVDIPKVYEVLFEKAMKGDMKAIKLIMDRVVPVTKAADLSDMDKGGLQINISVGTMPARTDDVVEADYEVVD